MAVGPISSHATTLLDPLSKRRPKPSEINVGGDRIQLKVTNEPLSLVYKSAIEHLNEALKAELGEDAIQATADSGMDFSPESVADRILSFATAGYASYQERHPDESGDNQLNGFLDLIRGAIDKGFEEARGILDSLGVLQGDIAANADRTYELIQEGLGQFEEEQRESADQEN